MFPKLSASADKEVLKEQNDGLPEIKAGVYKPHLKLEGDARCKKILHTQLGPEYNVTPCLVFHV